jgi:general secretion pathway protein G
MTLETPPAPHPHGHAPNAPALQSDTLPWTGVSVLLAILGLLLFLAVPERQLSPDELEEQRLSAQVALAYGRLRGAIEDYRSEHGCVPGTSADGSGFTQRDFRRQLMLHTDIEGHALPQALGSHPYGPYLQGDIPPNPLNGLTDVRIVRGRSLASEIDGESGWIYDPVADELCLNAPGQWGAYRGQSPRF